MIPLKELPDLLLTIAKADENLAGALMVFRDDYTREFLIIKDEFGEEKKIPNENLPLYRRRLIKLLEIPTYNKMKDVMYYDVLMKLSHQLHRYDIMQDKLKKTIRKLKIVCRLGK